MTHRTVTFIDADANLTRQLEDQLRRYGYRTESYGEANDVMQRKDDLPDLIVLCIDPKRTGWAVCNRLRKSAALGKIPLIITSAEATEKDFEDHKKLKTRAEDYLHKPFGVEALVEKVAAQIGMPEPEESSLVSSLDPEELSVEDDNVVVEDDISAPQMIDPGTQKEELSSFANEDSQDRTRIATSHFDDVGADADAAFAAIGVEVPVVEDEPATGIMHQEELAEAPQPPPSDDPHAIDSPFDEAELPGPLPEVEPTPLPGKSPSVDLDLGLDQVALQATEKPTARRPASGVFASAPAPAPALMPQVVHDTAQHDTSNAAASEIKAERDRLRREVDELKLKLSQKPEAAPVLPSSGGFSREREFLNLREIINKKEKELLDLRDSLDAKERHILDGKDKLRELERRSRDLDEKSLATERELVAAREKVEALTHDKERVVEREKQIKGRLDDALKTLSKYEEEIENWKKRHADDIAQLEKSYNDTVGAHQSEVQELKNRHHSSLEAVQEQHASQLRDTIDAHEAQKAELTEAHAAERGRLEAEHAAALQALRETKDAERDGLRLRFEQQNADLAEQHQVEIQALAEQHTTTVAQLKTEADAQMAEKDQLHGDEIAGMRARHTNEGKQAERRHADEINKLHEGYKSELQAAEERRQSDLAVKGEEHREQLEGVQREHLVEKGRLEVEHEAAVTALDQQRQEELATAQKAAAETLARTIKEHEQKLTDELKAMRDSHLRKFQALEESHADVKAGLQQRHTEQTEELQKQHATTVAEFEAALKERDQLITDGHARINELEGTLGAEQETTKRLQKLIGELEQNLAAAQNEIKDRDQRLGDKTQRIGDLEQESAGYQDQILKAYQRIKNDESIVQRAKKAMAIALTLLDESAPDESDKASS